jgi:hypothetical protein
MMNIAAQLDRTLKAAGVAIVGVSIGDRSDKSTWTVQPSTLQAAAQPTISAFDITAENTAWQWYEVRSQRDTLLGASDWTQLSGAPLDAAEVSAWAAYREVLRDIPQAQSDPYAITWPTPPFIINPMPL